MERTTEYPSSAWLPADPRREHLVDAWALFVDWCTATGHRSRPADRDTVERFFRDVPATPSTQVTRVRAIRLAHEAAGHVPPVPRPAPRPRQSAARAGEGWLPVRSAVRRCPAYGADGAAGRRDAWLLTLLGVAGLTRRQARHLRAADVDLDAWTILGRPVPQADDFRSCSRCVVTRWLHVLAAANTTFLDEVQAVVRRPRPEGHDCAHPVPSDWATGGDPLLLAFDRHGWFTPTRLTNRSVSQIVATRQRDDGVHDDDARWPLPVTAETHDTSAAREELDALLVELDEATERAAAAVRQAEWATAADAATIRQWLAQAEQVSADD